MYGLFVEDMEGWGYLTFISVHTKKEDAEKIMEEFRKEELKIYPKELCPKYYVEEFHDGQTIVDLEKKLGII